MGKSTAKAAAKPKAAKKPAPTVIAPPSANAGEIRKFNIYQKLAAIMGEIQPMEKGGTNNDQHYKFIEYAAVAGVLRSLFARYGVLIVPSMPALADQSRSEFSSKYGNSGVMTLIDFHFDIINVDNPDDRFTVNWTGEAADYGDKGTNKAATSALKYYLMRQFNISEKGEQEADNSTVDGTGATTSAPAPRQQQQTTTPPPASRPITQAQIDELSAVLSEKGIETIDDQTALLLKMTSRAAVNQISEEAAPALIERLRAAEKIKLFDYMGWPYEDDRPTSNERVYDPDTGHYSDDGGQTWIDPLADQETVDDTPPALSEEDEQSKAAEQAAIDLYQQTASEEFDNPAAAPIDAADMGQPELDTPEAAQDAKEVTTDFKTQVLDDMNALGLSAREKTKLINQTTGKFTIDNIDEAGWRVLANAVAEYAIMQGDAIDAADQLGTDPVMPTVDDLNKQDETDDDNTTEQTD